MNAAVAEYRRLVAELAGVARHRDVDLAAAERSYVEGERAVAAERVAAADAERLAAKRLAAATAAVPEVDREAARLWEELRGRLGWRGRRLGALPSAESTVDADAQALLRRTAERLEQSKKRAPLPRRVLPLLPFLGAAVAALVACLAAGLLALDAAVPTVLGQVVFFLAPFTGLPAAVSWVDRRYHARLDTGGIGLTVIGGMLACSLVMLTLS